MKYIFRILIMILLIGFAIYHKSSDIVMTVRTKNTEIYNLLHEDDIVVTTDPSDLKHGDLILYEGNRKKETMFSRIIALPNENVNFVNGEIYINEKKLGEGYRLDKKRLVEDFSFKTPDDSIFTLPDRLRLEKKVRWSVESMSLT